MSWRSTQKGCQGAEHVHNDSSRDFPECADHGLSKRGRILAKRYEVGELQLHLHVALGVRGEREPNYLCAVVNWAAGVLNVAYRPGDEIEADPLLGWDNNMQRSVLVEVAESVKNPKGVLLKRRVSSVMRLQGFDDCLCGRVDCSDLLRDEVRIRGRQTVDREFGVLGDISG